MTALLQEQLVDCCCEERQPTQHVPARVTNITPGKGEEVLVDADNASLPIVITFDKRLQPGSVDQASIQIVAFREKDLVNDAISSLSVAYEEATRSARLSGTFQAGLRYVVTVRGNEPNPIIDIDGLALDGDADANRTPGGNFVSDFVITHPQTPA